MMKRISNKPTQLDNQQLRNVIGGSISGALQSVASGTQTSPLTNLMSGLQSTSGAIVNGLGLAGACLMPVGSSD